MGDVVKVSDGFGRNYLIPQGLALPATGRKARQFEHQRAIINRRKEELKRAAEGLVGSLNGLNITLERKVGDEDKLFGSVTNRDIHAALTELGFDLDRRKIVLAQPLKELGIYEVTIRLHSEVRATIRVWITAAA